MPLMPAAAHIQEAPHKHCYISFGHSSQCMNVQQLQVGHYLILARSVRSPCCLRWCQGLHSPDSHDPGPCTIGSRLWLAWGVGVWQCGTGWAPGNSPGKLSGGGYCCNGSHRHCNSGRRVQKSHIDHRKGCGEVTGVGKARGGGGRVEDSCGELHGSCLGVVGSHRSHEAL
jgi:hypothetical protein